MLAVISGALQLIFLILNNYFEKDKAEKKRKEDLHEKLKDAIKRGDSNAVNDLLSQLRP